MWRIFWREVDAIKSNYWDLSLLTIAPLFVIVFLSTMLMQGSPRHLPIVVVDQDHSSYSRQIVRNLQATPSLTVYAFEPSMQLAQTHLKQLKAWGVVHIPPQAELNLVRGKSPQIASYYNEAFFSIASTVSAGISSAVNAATRQQQHHLISQLGLPPIEFTMPVIQVTALYNPQLSYELFLEPFAITAILHLLIACCVAVSIGRELPAQHMKAWLGQQSILTALFAKLAPYILIFSVWCFLWTAWMVGIRGWAIQGSVLLLVSAQILLFTAYALFASLVVLALKDVNTGLSGVAMYAGSSLSFAGVTLPTIGAPLFTRIWSDSLPYTAYSEIQTQQWVVGSPLHTSMPSFLILLAFVLGFGAFSLLLLKRHKKLSIA